MRKSRIKYYEISDLSSSYFMNAADSFLNNFDFKQVTVDINIIIECFNITKYIEAGISDRWAKNTKSKLNKYICIFFHENIDKSLVNLYNSVENEYRSDFWELFSRFKLFNIYDLKSFSHFIDNQKPNIIYLLQNKNIVNKYEDCLKQYFLSDFNNITILINKYEIINDKQNKNIYLPNTLSNKEKEGLIKLYIESDHPNMNYLNIISNLKNRDEIKITDKTRLLAKRRIERDTEIFFKKNDGHKTGVTVEYSRNQKEELNYSQEDGITHLIYSYNWIKNNLDENTLLNNFIHLFEYVDGQMRITLTSKMSEIGKMEEIFSVRSKNNYHDGFVFQHKDMISNLQLYSYISILESFNINLENLLVWFFNDYLKEHFQIDGFTINIPSKNVTYFEKCRTIVPEIESILKKYNLIVEDGYIDNELLEISSNSLSFANCKSFFEKKYIYPKSDEFNQACSYFFSDQCMLNYIENEDKSYKTFYDLLNFRKVYLNEYDEYLHSQIKWLVDMNYLSLSQNNEICIQDNTKLLIIRDLYYNETISYMNIPKIGQNKIDELLASDYFFSENSLFSKTEQHYFNYILNKSEYGNSLDLRNKYVHGTQPDSKQDSEIHKYNYIIFLKIIILIIIKINDELCNKISRPSSAVRSGEEREHI